MTREVSAPESLEGTQPILWSGFPVVFFVELICYISLIYINSCILLVPVQRPHWSRSGIRSLSIPLSRPSSCPLGSQDHSPGLSRLKEHEFFVFLKLIFYRFYRCSVIPAGNSSDISIQNEEARSGASVGFRVCREKPEWGCSCMYSPCSHVHMHADWREHLSMASACSKQANAEGAAAFSPAQFSASCTFSYFLGLSFYPGAMETLGLPPPHWGK